MNTEKYFLFVTFADIITKNMNTSKKITVQSTEISVLIGNESDYICLQIWHLSKTRKGRIMSYRTGYAQEAQ